MNDKDSTGITPACKQQAVSTIEIYPDYWRWERAFRELTGWPPEPVAVEELRSQLAVSIPSDGLTQSSIEQEISVEKAVKTGVLNHFSTAQKVELATVEETLQLENGFVRFVWPKWTAQEPGPDSAKAGEITQQQI